MGEDRAEPAGVPGQPPLTVGDIRPAGTLINQVPWSSWMTGRPMFSTEDQEQIKIQLENPCLGIQLPADARTVEVANFCNMQLNAKVAVGVAIEFIPPDGHAEILLIHKIDRHWEVPGGKLEPGETLHECAVREVEEETGLNIRTRHIIGVYSNKEKDGQTMIFVFFLGHIVGSSGPYTSSFKPNYPIKLEMDKHDEYQWVKFSDLRSFPDLAPRLKSLVNTGSWLGELFDRQVTDEFSEEKKDGGTK